MTMQHVILLSCASRKLDHPAPAGELYISPLFKLSLRYALQQAPAAIFILSAKHGLLPLDQVIEPYNLTLKSLDKPASQAWAEQVAAALASRFPLQTTRFTLLAGKRYTQHLLPLLPHTEQPLTGLGIGRRLRFLKEHLHE